MNIQSHRKFLLASAYAGLCFFLLSHLPGIDCNKCPHNRPRSNCFANPCKEAHVKCPRFSHARCEADYCGGCHARFYTGLKEVTDRCGIRNVRATQKQETDACPPDAPRVACLVAPCERATCPNYPSAVCRNNYCGGCYAGFFAGSTNITSSCGSTSASMSG